MRPCKQPRKMLPAPILNFFWRSSGDPPAAPRHELYASGLEKSYEDEDAFMVVGETRSERSTVNPSHLQGMQKSHYVAMDNSLPPYPGVLPPHMEKHPQRHPDEPYSGVLPPYIEEHRQRHPDEPYPGVLPPYTDEHQQRHPAEPAKQETVHGPALVSDIPFELNSHLRLLFEWSQNSGAFNVPNIRQLDLQRYHYDFDVELEVIRSFAQGGQD